MKTTVINLYGGPGTGKSTTMAALFVELKRQGHLVEMAHEWVKHPVWAGETHVLADQLYILAKQNRTLRRLYGAVEFIVTDAPLRMSCVYSDDHLVQIMARALDNQYRSVDVFLRRQKPYEPAGRVQTEENARLLDAHIYMGLALDWVEVDADERAAEIIIGYLNEEGILL